ncbi:hypoxanthine phosphoribosyltransferase [Fuchsiella alkaliacetigena]|uniref:hypoxanthine phosphoribosyltransferase n=1 Tax=Fuchsiella alkaliacetigena TaxID=957042 RepID=UPI00200B42C5|nr:hypoxanthine phosphoribosyltransferase [Fuchsiella alkaliacetigena]MCK8824898.1 hypoxanthine phosphoribosyltransferase [Fuchsiella alkaliacetigena]
MRADLKEKVDRVLITEEEIKKRVKKLGAQITADYSLDDDIVMVGILRGAVMFMSDLARCVDLPVTLDFMDVSSYDGTKSSGIVRIIKDLEENIAGRHILIVEDIIDTGLTLRHVVSFLETRNPASIKICTLLDKPERRKEKKVEVDYNGFEIPDEFVVGYGLDYQEKFRNLPYIFVLKEEFYE